MSQSRAYSPPAPRSASALLRFQIDDAERIGRTGPAERHAGRDRQTVADAGDPVVLSYSYRFRNHLAERADAFRYVNGMNPIGQGQTPRGGVMDGYREDRHWRTFPCGAQRGAARLSIGHYRLGIHRAR